MIPSSVDAVLRGGALQQCFTLIALQHHELIKFLNEFFKKKNDYGNDVTLMKILIMCIFYYIIFSDMFREVLGALDAVRQALLGVGAPAGAERQSQHA